MKGLFYTWNVMKPSYLISLTFTMLLTGCIAEDKNDSLTVTLKNFRSASELSYKTSNTDWVEIEANLNDIFTFETDTDRKYEVSIDCPFNEKGNSRLYFLTQNSFPTLDLGCDKVITRDQLESVNSQGTDYNFLDVAFEGSYLLQPTSDYYSWRNELLSDVFFNKRRVDQDIPNDLVGVAQLPNEFCKYYFQQNIVDVDQALSALTFRDSTHLLDMPLYSYTGRTFHVPLAYHTKDGGIHHLKNGCVNFDIPQSIRAQGDGYLTVYSRPHKYEASSSIIPHHLIWSDQHWYESNVPEVEIPEFKLNPYITLNQQLGRYVLKFNKAQAADFKPNYYSLKKVIRKFLSLLITKTLTLMNSTCPETSHSLTPSK